MVWGIHLVFGYYHRPQAIRLSQRRLESACIEGFYEYGVRLVKGTVSVKGHRRSARQQGLRALGFEFRGVRPSVESFEFF